MATILIVDDQPTNRQFLVTLLGYAGHQLLEAADGAQALGLARERHPDLVITDLLMPTMDGYEFVRQLRADPNLVDIRVIFYSATYRQGEARSLAKAAGVQYVLSKPAEPQVILDMVTAALGLELPLKLAEITAEPLLDPLQVVTGKLAVKMGELGSLGHRLEALVDVVLKIASERQPERLLEIACKATPVIVGAQYAAIGILETDGRSLKHFTTSGVDPETITRIGQLPTEKGVLAKLLADGLPLRLSDVSADPDAVGFPPGHPPMRSFLGVPLVSSTALYGFLYLAEKTGAAEFSEEDERVAVALAAQIAVAYESAQRYDLIQRHAANLQLEISERKQAEENLRQSEKKFTDAFRQSPAAMTITRIADGTFVDANEAFLHTFGFTRDEVIGHTSTELNILDLAARRTLIEQQPASGGLRNAELEARSKSGQIINILFSSLPIEIDHEPHHITTMIDITDRKQAEESLKLENERFQRFVESNIVGIVIADTSGKVITANDYYLRLLGLTRQDFLDGNVDWRKFTPPEWLPADEKAIRELRAYGVCEGYEKEYERADGTRVPVYIADAMLPGPEEQIAAFVIDISERRRAENALRASEQRFSTLFAKAPYAITLSRLPDGVIVDANEAFERIFGFTQQEAIGKTPLEVGFNPDAEIRTSLSAQLAQNNSAYVPEMPLQMRSGESRIFSLHTDSVDIGGEKYMLTSGEDITERKRAEDALRESQLQLAGIIESAMDAVVIIDANQKITLFNRAAETVFGYSAAELIGQPHDRLLPERYRATHKRQVERFGETGVISRAMDSLHPLIGLRANGEEFPMEASISQIEVAGKKLSTAILRDITNRRQAEEALHESEEKYRAFFENSLDAALLTLPDGSILAANEAACKMLGRSEAEICALGRNRLMDAADPRLPILLAQRAKSGKAFGELNMLRANGTLFPVEISSSIFHDSQRNEKTSMIIRDITERKRAEEALSQSEKRFRALTENISDVIVMVDREGLITYVGPAITRVLGYTVGELVGQNEFGFVHPEDLEIARQSLKRVLDGQGVSVSFLTRQRHKDGSWRWVEGVGTNLLAEPGVEGIVVNFRDITERVESEEKIKRQLQRLKALRTIDMAISTSFDMKLSLTVLLNESMMHLGVSAAAILLYNPETRTLDYAVGKGFASPAIEQTRLRIGEGLAGRVALKRRKTSVANLVEASDRYTRRELLKAEGFVSYYATPLAAKGELKGVLEVFHRAKLEPNQEWLDFVETLAGQAAIAIDNSNLFIHLQRANAELEERVVQRTAELHQLNSELQHANRAKDEFLANMSHELRTPLNSILGLSEALLEQRGGSLNERQQRYLQTVESSGRHLLELINDILDLSKIEAGKFDYYPEPVLVDDLCRASLAFIRSQAAKKSITVTYENRAAISQIFADPRRLKQILVNLLTNAVKFTPEKGEVRLQVSTRPEEGLLQFCVMDTGIGMAAEDLQRLFQPFVQVESSLNRHHEGTGLGLALVQKLTDLHGGSVEVESEVGKGSRFAINLPCRQESITQPVSLKRNEQPSAAESPVTDEETVRPRVVLLAEDNLANIQTMGEYIEIHGFKLVTAQDGWEALAKAEETGPDIILMDIQMPAMDGLEATRRLRADTRFAATPIIALTALAMPGDRERCLEAGATEYMSKPVSLKLLVKTIRQLLTQEQQNT